MLVLFKMQLVAKNRIYHLIGFKEAKIGRANGYLVKHVFDSL